MKQLNNNHKGILMFLFGTVLTSTVLFAGCQGNRTKNENSNDNNNPGITQASSSPEIVSEKVTYMSDKDTLIGYLFYDKNSTAKKPGIIVVHEWWGNNDYPQSRARQLAELGYVALSADMYGMGKTVDNPKDAQTEAGKVYSDPKILKNRMMAAYNELNKSDKVESGKIAAIGYCFGGSVCLNAANMGVPLKTVVSFHGTLDGFKANPQIKNTPVLICNGRADKFVTREQLQSFKKQMTDIKANFEIKEYADATHAFTNPASTANGKKFNMPIAYNEAADKASWQDMKDFFAKNFPAK
jgi:dienelactone hydrolase